MTLRAVALLIKAAEIAEAFLVLLAIHGPSAIHVKKPASERVLLGGSGARFAPLASRAPLQFAQQSLVPGLIDEGLEFRFRDDTICLGIGDDLGLAVVSQVRLAKAAWTLARKSQLITHRSAAIARYCQKQRIAGDVGDRSLMP